MSLCQFLSIFICFECSNGKMDYFNKNLSNKLVVELKAWVKSQLSTKRWEKSLVYTELYFTSSIKYCTHASYRFRYFYEDKLGIMMNVSIFIHLLFLQYFFLAENKMYHILNVICCKLIFLGAYRGNTDAQVMWRISIDLLHRYLF